MQYLRLRNTASPSPNWLPRAIVSGFAASVVMLVVFIAGYGIAAALSHSGPWAGRFDALIHNPALSLAGGALYLAVGIHLVAGMLWALAYAYFAETRLRGPDPIRGVQFSLVLWLLSLLVFLPIVGAGILGLATGAGPLPAIGNLILHISYGLVLGFLYGPPEREALTDNDDQEANSHEERALAGGVIGGLAVGLVIGLLMKGSLASFGADLGFTLSPWFFVIGIVLMCGAWGIFIGSLAGINYSTQSE